VGNGDYPTLRTLLHPSGSWEFVSTNVRIFSDPDELVDAIRHEQERKTYKLYTVTHEPLAASVVLAGAYIRTARAGGRGHGVGRQAFLCEVRDGLFFRSEAFPSEAQARAAFESGWGGNVSPADELPPLVRRQPGSSA
jgi:hypothetical protein